MLLDVYPWSRTLPSALAELSLEYKTDASMTVFEAPGTLANQPIACRRKGDL